MCLWEQIDGERLYTEIPWVPYVYIPTNKSDIKNIYGRPVAKKTFPDYYSYTNFLKENDGPNIFENKVRMETQFLGERYHGIPDEEIPVPNLKTYYLDIEVMGTEGFPDPKDANDPIILISIRDSDTSRTITFGYDIIEDRKYNGDNARYIACDTEEQLLKRFFAYIRKYPCDVISGWNIWAFDLPYIFNRTKNLLGEDKGNKAYRKMSPINVVNVWKQKLRPDEVNIDMGGIAILDYYSLYRWYGKKLERYTLEYVSQKELKSGKLDWHSLGYKDLNEFAEKDWDTFVDYNIVDCERVHDLENQLGYIRTVQALSLLCKAPMKYYNAMTQLIEGAMVTHFRRNKLCAPHFFGGHQKTFTAAHVKEPNIGLWNWVVDVDITSSYPSHIIALNMSLETFMGIITGMSEREVIDYTNKRKFPSLKMVKEVDHNWTTVNLNEDQLKKFNSALGRGLLAIAPCGSVFSTKKTGVIAEVEKSIFFKRKEVKGMRNDFGNRVNECEGLEQKQCKDRERELDALQLAQKLMMNAFFGILAVPYSRYFNVYIAEAITSCGRHTIKSGERFCNELLNNPVESEELNSILHEMKVNSTQYKDMKINIACI